MFTRKADVDGLASFVKHIDKLVTENLKKKAKGTVIVLAPERNWSATSHAKTMHKPLRLQTVTLADGSEAYCSSGSPTDCVALAEWICDVLDNPNDDNVIAGVRANVEKQCKQFPVYG